MSYRDSHLDRGKDYDRVFAAPHTAMLWRLEQNALRKLLRKHVRPGASHLDFACGTGRILALLAPEVGRSVGVDISAGMLEKAKERVPTARFVVGDLTREALLGDERFDVITAFRFFPNAEPALREEVARALVKHLAPGGVLIFNNHNNRASLTRFAMSALGKDTSIYVWPRDILAPLVGVGLRVVDEVGLGLVPSNDRHMPVPSPILEPLERAAAKVPKLRELAADRIYVMKRD